MDKVKGSAHVGANEMFATFLAEDGHDKPWAHDYSMARTFRNISVSGKSALDIGSGRGLTSLWLALQGADRVVSMEPELQGSRSGATHIQRQRVEKLGLHQIEFVSNEFENYHPQQPFDIVVANSSINHLRESSLHALRDRETFDSFVGLASKISQWLKPDGVAVITDACRYGFFALARTAGLPKRFCYYSKTLNYKIHQNAATWQKIMRQAGFNRTEVEYPIPYALRLAEPLINNSVVNFFLQGSFILRAWR